MKIAFPTDDRKSIAKRTGRCKEFAIYEIEDKTVKNIGYIENTHRHHDHGHGHSQVIGHGRHKHAKGEGEHSHEEIGAILNDTDILIVGRVGKFMKKALESFGIKYLISKNSDIEEALKAYLDS